MKAAIYVRVTEWLHGLHRTEDDLYEVVNHGTDWISQGGIVLTHGGGHT